MTTSSLTTLSPLLSWPPAYKIRLSARAKGVHLHISAKAGLEVVIPKHRIRMPNIERLLSEKRTWIEKHLPHYLKLQEEQKSLSPACKPYLLDLRGIQKLIHFSYHYNENKHIKIRPNPEFLNGYIVSGPTDQEELVFKALRRFLKEIASQYFIPWIKTLSEQTDLYYSEIIIRSQSTLWGSCTASRKISLNCKLLFLPPHLVRYILLHELCHIRYLNHSKRFWDLVTRFDPNCFSHRRSMKDAGKYVPTWVEDIN